RSICKGLPQVAVFRILIVEDHQDFRESLKEVLIGRLPRAEILEAREGNEVLPEILAHPPHLIFMDINIPGENGLELTRKIKQNFPQIVVVILTSYDVPEYREAAYRYGANYFLAKGTTNGQKLLGLIESILTERGFDVNDAENAG
ncbi:MAG: response regulator transcription factor, partial [Thermodesulfobacteriota bacterium]